MTLETERLVLRPWTEEDAASLYEYAKEPRIGPAAGWAPHHSVEDSREVIKTILSAEGTCAVMIKGLPGPVGSVGIFHDKAIGGKDDLEVGYWIGYPFWGRGYIPEAVEALLGYGFNTLGERRMWCAHYAGNDNSRRVIEKCGFRREFMKEADVPALGERRIEIFYSLLRTEWENRHGEKL